jgi:hypothetical protein
MKIHGASEVVESSWNVMAHGDVREGKWRGNWRMEWVASTLHTNSELGVSNITTADAHTSPASSRLNWRPADLNGLVRFAERRNLVSVCLPSYLKRSLQLHAFLTSALDELCGQRFVSGRKKRGTHLTGNHVRSVHYLETVLERNLSLLPHVRSRADNLRLGKYLRNTCSVDSDIRLAREHGSVTTRCAKKLSSSSSLN